MGRAGYARTGANAYVRGHGSSGRRASGDETAVDEPQTRSPHTWAYKLEGRPCGADRALARERGAGSQSRSMPPRGARAQQEQSACNRADLGHVSTSNQVRIQVNRRWSTDQITLDLVAGFLGKEVEFALGFHTLSDDRKVQPPSQPDD